MKRWEGGEMGEVRRLSYLESGFGFKRSQLDVIFFFRSLKNSVSECPAEVTVRTLEGLFKFPLFVPPTSRLFEWGGDSRVSMKEFVVSDCFPDAQGGGVGIFSPRPPCSSPCSACEGGSGGCRAK